MGDLIELAERVEAMRRPDNGIDREIAFAVGWTRATPAGLKFEYWFDPNGKRADPGDFTGSIDAAMTLVPDGYLAQVWRGIDGEGSATCSQLKQINLPRVFGAIPAMALTSAALRARASDTTGKEG